MLLEHGEGNRRARGGVESVNHCMLTEEKKNGNMDETHPSTCSDTRRDRHGKNGQGTIRTVLNVVGHFKKGSAQVVQWRQTREAVQCQSPPWDPESAWIWERLSPW